MRKEIQVGVHAALNQARTDAEALRQLTTVAFKLAQALDMVGDRLDSQRKEINRLIDDVAALAQKPRSELPDLDRPPAPAWDRSKAYRRNDRVTHAGERWVCVEAHATPNLPRDAAGTLWAVEP